MRSTRTPASRRGRRTVLAATGLVAALALTATACNGSEDSASDKPDATSSQAAADGGGKAEIPADLAGKLKEHGIDVDRWKDGGWKDWNKDKWLSDAKDFVNPVIEGLWKPERMQSAEEADKTVTTKDASAGQGVSDPDPAPVRAQAEKTPYHRNAAPVGKVFFDSPDGPAVCSGTVVKDVNHPGKSNLVWTAGHCVHAGGNGGWYRNIVFVPAYNTSASPRRSWATPTRARSRRTATGGRTGPRPRTSGSRAVRRPAATEPRTTTPCCT